MPRIAEKYVSERLRKGGTADLPRSELVALSRAPLAPFIADPTSPAGRACLPLRPPPLPNVYRSKELPVYPSRLEGKRT